MRGTPGVKHIKEKAKEITALTIPRIGQFFHKFPDCCGVAVDVCLMKHDDEKEEIAHVCNFTLECYDIFGHARLPMQLNSRPPLFLALDRTTAMVCCWAHLKQILSASRKFKMILRALSVELPCLFASLKKDVLCTGCQ
jgi:hypothetical protein